MKKKTNKEKSKFAKNLKKYVLVLCVLSIVFLIYVMNTLYQYEASYTENYMVEFVKDLNKSAKSGKVDKICNINNVDVNNLDKNKNNVKSAIENKIKTSDISFKLNEKKSQEEQVYGIYANNEKIMDVTLNVKKHNKRLGMFSYPVWQVKDCKIASDKGLYYYDIIVPDNYTVNVNGNKLDNSYVSDSITDEGYQVLTKYVNLPKMVNYKLEKFITEPDIVISDENGSVVDYEIKNHKVELKSLHKTAENYEQAKSMLASEIDVLDIAENWSLFLTDDLKGTRHGFNNLSQYLIKGTALYDMGYSWATSIDITFTSKHTLKNPAFTNTKVSDFEIYGENAFSCVVYLEKNMKIANGNDKVDVMHDKLYFVYYDGTNDGKDNPEWKLVEMKSVANNK